MDTLKIGNEGSINPNLELVALDEPGAGGAHHVYVIQSTKDSGVEPPLAVKFSFQNGGIAENGINGITNEALLAIVIHRLEGFQSGKFANDETAAALDSCKAALASLAARTADRVARGVEGLYKP